MSIANIPIENVVADICGGSFHPFYEDRPFGDVKVVREKVVGVSWRFPVELSRNFAPEFLGRLDRLFVHLLVLF